MGFKRTAEGRVFFEDPEEQEQSGGKDLQIVGLLRALNERLKKEQVERSKLIKEVKKYKQTIEDLDERSARSEQAYIDLEQKVAARQNEDSKKVARAEQVTKETLHEVLETRQALNELEEKTQLSGTSFSVLKDQLAERKKTEDLLRKHQLALEKMHKDQSEKMVGSVAAYVALTKRVGENETKFETLDNKIEEATTEQSRLERKMEKAAQDRSRMLRKVDRIEETVIQTRDALNAKAMVVLTDQPSDGAAPKIAQKESEPEPALLENKAEMPGPWWQKTMNLQTTGVTTILVAGVLAGLLLSQVQLKGNQGFSLFNQEKNSPAPVDEAKWDTDFEVENIVRTERVEPVLPVLPNIGEEPAVEAQAVVLDKITEADMTDDIGALDLNDEDKLLAALEGDVDALAARLNEIEPGKGMGDSNITVSSATADPVEFEFEEVEIVNLQPEPTSEPKIQPKPETQKQAGLRDRIKPDSSLPKVVKEIEAQAFEGSAEAQHDLAAIYTAGHGGAQQDYQRAALWFREAAEGGISNARYNLGVLYHQGMGVQQDLGEAIKWYRMASELGHPEAQYNLGIAYIEGIGVTYDPHKASTYFENAAGDGVTEAAYNLGLIYENGLLGDTKPDEALVWYKKAADAGSPEAKTALEQLAKTLGVKLSDVNRLVEEMNGTAAAPVVKSVRIVKEAAPRARTAPQPPPQQAIAIPQEPTQDPVLLENTERVLIAQVQEYLMRLGLYPGPADGLSGPLTQDAIRSYQLFNDLGADGAASEELLQYMIGDVNSSEYGSRE